MKLTEPEKKGLQLSDFEESPGGFLKCHVCGAEYDRWTCKCGKYGTREMMEKHVEERHSKGTKAALEAHELIAPPLPEDDMPSVTTPLFKTRSQHKRKKA